MKPQEETTEEIVASLGIPASVQETKEGHRVIVMEVDDDEVDALHRNVE